MANVDAKSGFKPLRHLGGGVVRASEYLINTSGTTGFNDNLFTGDPVVLNADGTIEIATNNTAAVLGIFYGCQYIASDGSVVFSPNWVASTAVKAGTTIKAMVYDDPNISFEVQATTCASTDIGLVCDFVIGTGNTTTGRSGGYIDQADTTNGSFRILRLIERAGNEYGAYAKVEVLNTSATLRSATSI